MRGQLAGRQRRSSSAASDVYKGQVRSGRCWVRPDSSRRASLAGWSAVDWTWASVSCCGGMGS